MSLNEKVNGRRVGLWLAASSQASFTSPIQSIFIKPVHCFEIIHKILKCQLKWFAACCAFGSGRRNLVLEKFSDGASDGNTCILSLGFVLFYPNISLSSRNATWPRQHWSAWNCFLPTCFCKNITQRYTGLHSRHHGVLWRIVPDAIKAQVRFCIQQLSITENPYGKSW